MIKFIRTNSKNPDFIDLVKDLDAYLAFIDGEEHVFYAQLNKTHSINYVVVAYENDKPVGCGALKEFAQNIMEIKRMYTSPGSRGKGVATGILNELELWAKELSCQKCVLETGIRQQDAVGLYIKNGYNRIPNYGKYVGIENSVCFEKELNNVG
jgi:GNAT superfamily N-acetyltransferase